MSSPLIITLPTGQISISLPPHAVLGNGHRGEFNFAAGDKPFVLVQPVEGSGLLAVITTTLEQGNVSVIPGDGAGEVTLKVGQYAVGGSSVSITTRSYVRLTGEGAGHYIVSWCCPGPQGK